MQLKGSGTTNLELLAPAGNSDIGIAAIDCGADAVYIAGPAFGAREAAGNPFTEIARLATHAHRYNAKVYLTLNTILYESELEKARKYIFQAYEAGCDAVIIQDLGILEMDLPPIPLHASTQCDIRTVAQAKFLESLGFERLILARELSILQIREISEAVRCEVESFVHGALCVSYSGQCYLSQYLSGRSANRGACIQACRSRYDLIDQEGRTILRNRPILSLKDLSLKDSLKELADAGVCSFKVEGRLKNISYVKNVIKAYRETIDSIVDESGGKYRRASIGKVEGGFTPDIANTFNRGYTDYFLHGRNPAMNSGLFAKAVGEYIGTVGSIVQSGRESTTFRIASPSGARIANGDGLCIVSANGEITGARADIAGNDTVTSNSGLKIRPGMEVYRNYNRLFEKELENNMPERLIGIYVSFMESGPATEEGKKPYTVTATAEDGTSFSTTIDADTARNTETAIKGLRDSFSKKSGIYRFSLQEFPSENPPFMPASRTNALRNEIAATIDRMRTEKPEPSAEQSVTSIPFDRIDRSKVILPERRIRLNCSNSLSEKLYRSIGITPDTAYELKPSEDMELMRCKYCIRHELGLCPKLKKGEKATPLYLVNNSRKLKLSFDCARCEMTVTATPAGKTSQNG